MSAERTGQLGEDAVQARAHPDAVLAPRLDGQDVLAAAPGQGVVGDGERVEH